LWVVLIFQSPIVFCESTVIQIIPHLRNSLRNCIVFCNPTKITTPIRKNENNRKKSLNALLKIILLEMGK